MNVPLIDDLASYVAKELSSATKHKYTSRTISNILKSSQLQSVLASRYKFIDDMNLTERASFVAGMNVDDKLYLIESIIQYMI